MDLWALTDLCTPWCVHVVATLRVANQIDAGITEIGALATAVHADRDALHRVLRQLVGKGLFEEPSPGRFALNDPARQLLSPMMLLGLDLESMGGRMAHAWGTLLTAVRTGRPAYHEAFGLDFWGDLEANPHIAADFDAMMGPAGHGIPSPEVLLDASDWASIKTVVDVGGGTGALLAEVLKAHPQVRGILVDVPRTVARSREMFESAGVADRVTTSAQSFFDPLPAGADVYMMDKVLHDWPDREAKMLLQRCAEAARPNGRVVIVSGVTPEEQASPELLMLVLVGGKNRTLAEFRELARESGLEVKSEGRAASGRFIVECEAV